MSNIVETDIVVIGSGATGLSAALTAAENGARVIMFEKQKSMGGTSNFFHGTFAVESLIQRQQFVDYTKGEAFKGIMEYSHWLANPRLVRTIVDESANGIIWLEQQGVEFIEVTTNMPGCPRTYHIVKGHGAALVKTLTLKAKEKGVNIRLEQPVTQILKDGDRITGVIAERNGEEMEVAAKAVIVASGGFANNKEWIKKYTGFDLNVNVLPVGNVGKMGDGIRMAWEVGAASEGMAHLHSFAVGPIGPDFDMFNKIEITALQPDLWVDPRGERYCDETIGLFDTNMGNAASRFKEGFTYRLFDDAVLARLSDWGIEKNAGSDYLSGTKLFDVDKELIAAVERGSSEVFMADSVEELGVKMGVDVARIKATVDEYNGFCVKGHDDLFAKDRRYLHQLKGPRYYAVKARTIFLGTLGGLKINQNMEVID